MKYTTFISLLKSVQNPIDLLLANLEWFRRWSWRLKIRFTLKEVQIILDQNHICIVESNGDQYWCQHGKVHRDHDKPAVILSTGTQEWYQHDKCHRDHDRPAVIGYDGYQAWYQYGKKTS